MLQSRPFRYRIAAVTWSSCLAAAILFCLLPPDAPAAPGPKTQSRVPAAVPGLQVLPDDAGRHTGTTRTAAPLAEEPLPPQQYMHLVLKDHYQLPPWSGTARFGFGVVKNPIEHYDVSSLGADWYLSFWSNVFKRVSEEDAESSLEIFLRVLMDSNREECAAVCRGSEEGEEVFYSKVETWADDEIQTYFSLLLKYVSEEIKGSPLPGSLTEEEEENA